MSTKGKSKLNLQFLENFGEIEQFKETGVLKEGDSFGELALISEKPRAATIICKEYCVFATLNKPDFARILSSESQRILLEKVKFLRKIPIFENLVRGSLQKITYYLEEICFCKNQFVYKVGDFVKFVYFVKSGEFRMARWKNLKKQVHEDLLLRRVSKNVEPKESLQNLDLLYSIKSQYELIGHDELLQNLQTREFSVSCLSRTGTLYSFPSSEFFSYISGPESKSFFQNKTDYFNLRKFELEKTEEILENAFKPKQQKSSTKNSFNTGIKKKLNSFSLDLNKLAGLNRYKKLTVEVRKDYSKVNKKFIHSAIPSPRGIGSPGSDKNSPKVANESFKALSRLPPPNFMIGMRDLNKYYTKIKPSDRPPRHASQ